MRVYQVFHIFPDTVLGIIFYNNTGGSFGERYVVGVGTLEYSAGPMAYYLSRCIIGGDSLHHISDVPGTETLAPFEFQLSQNYPNPFNPSTRIEFEIKELSFVELKVYNVLGKEVAVLVNEEKSPGKYSVRFNASHLSSGVYFYRLQAGVNSSERSMVLLK